MIEVVFHFLVKKFAMDFLVFITFKKDLEVYNFFKYNPPIEKKISEL